MQRRNGLVRHDGNGNRLSLMDAIGTTVGSYDVQDRLTNYRDLSFNYDEAGDVVSRTIVSSGATDSFDHDALGSLVEATLSDGRLLGEVVLFPVIPSIDIQIPGETRAWNMAHLEGITNGLLLMGLAAVAPLLALTERQSRTLFWSAVITGWGFTLPAWANALSRSRSRCRAGRRDM
jgi:hypothetical protein